MLKLETQRILILLFLIFVGHGNLSAGENEFSSKPSANKQFSLNENNSKLFENKLSTKNILLSLILPGLGEWVGGEKGRAKIFIVTELSLWASFWGSGEYAKVLERDYFAYAAVHAGVDPRDKDKQYWIDIGNANNIYQFNERRRVQRNLEATYPESEKYFWQWDKDENRIEYSGLRDKQNNWKRVGTFIIGGMILNRIVSTIDVIRLIRKSKNSQDNQKYSYLHWSYFQNKFQGDVIKLNITLRF